MERKPAGKKYNDDFKKTIVDLYHSGSSVKELDSEYDASEVTIYKWVKDFTPISSEKEALTPKELADIQKENLRLKQEVEILKKLWPYSRKSNRSRA
ncbi:transposase [Pseudobacillus badius]|uniref:transposase n=1 Tax=Bacillus badius TaxID=1455 RepID=UPI000A76CB1B|nr:transposase [Bacillus badius]